MVDERSEPPLFGNVLPKEVRGVCEMHGHYGLRQPEHGGKESRGLGVQTLRCAEQHNG